METCRIYLSGGMSGLTEEEQTVWRKKIRDAVMFEDYKYEKRPYFFDPTQHYSIFENEHKSEREAMEYDLYKLRNSDLVVVNFNASNSIGTTMELALAKEHRIPVIGINTDGKELHPWLIECCTRMCDSLREAVDYLIDYYLD